MQKRGLKVSGESEKKQEEGRMMKKYVLKLLTVFAAVSMLSAVSVRADAVEDARIQKEIEDAKLEMERTYRASIYAACVEETRIAKEYLGSLETLCKVNPYYEGSLEAARLRIERAEEAQAKAEKALKTVMEASETPQETVTVPKGEKQELGVVNKDGILTASFCVETTGSPIEPSASLIISDFPEEYLSYEGYNILARYYTKERLKETSEQSDSAGKKTGTITVTGEMPEGGYADQVAVEIFVEKDHSFVFLWDDDGSLRVTDRE